MQVQPSCIKVSQDCILLVKAGVSSEGLTGKKSVSKLNHVVVDKSSIPYRLLGLGPQFLSGH